MLHDSHNHLHLLANPALAIEEMRAVGVRGCVVNATTEADWPVVARLADEFPDFVQPAFGIHPWHAHQALPGWQHRLETILSERPTAAVGECGLDRAIDRPALDQQQAVFALQVSLARTLDRTLVIHCVRAWGALLDCFKHSPPPSRLLLHSFDGSLETARRLVPLGVYFSFSARFLHPHRHAAAHIFAKLPADRLLIESDAPNAPPPSAMLTHVIPNGEHHPANLPVIAHALAAIRQLPMAELAAILAKNHQSCFHPSQSMHHD